MDKKEKRLALDALKDLIYLIENDQIIEFNCEFNLSTGRFSGMSRHKGGLPEISQGFIRIYHE